MAQTNKKPRKPALRKTAVISRRTGIVKATKEQLESVGISDVPNGALVEIYEIDKYESVYGLASKMRYKYEDFDYIIPTSWVD
jgi:hypothetical protein